jgi:hypothetical protein
MRSSLDRAFGFSLGLLLSLGFFGMGSLSMLGCQNVDPEASPSAFRIEGDTAWQGYSRLIIVIASPGGEVIDTLFNDSLEFLSQLHRLQTPNYQGGQVLIGIYGYRGSTLIFSQGRDFDGSSQRVLAIRDTLPLLGTPTPIAATPTGPTSPSTTPNPDSTPLVAAPQLAALSRDTTVSIRDVVPMFAQVQSGGSRILKVTWDFENDGRVDDSTTKTPTGARFTSNPRYNGVGVYVCRVSVQTAAGKSHADIRVSVIEDPPIADAGADTTVRPGTAILLHAKGSDGYGPIVKREWQIGSAAFKAIGQQETQIIAPLIEGDLRCILRITDSDGLTALDTLMVRIESEIVEGEVDIILDVEVPDEVILDEELVME